MKKIGILTGGGDVPGLNPAIKAATLRAIDAGYEMVGIRRGWRGLVGCLADDASHDANWTLPLDAGAVRTVDRSGGTFLHTSRTNPSNMRENDIPEHLSSGIDSYPADVTPHVLSVLERLGIDVLIAIGGDDTLSYAARLDREGFPVVAIPKTMDNDVNGTEYCIGFSTAVSRSVRLVNDLRTSAGSHERIAVIELFGRYCGLTALYAGYLSGADRAIIPEVPFEMGRLAELLDGDKAANPSRYAVVLVSEGAAPRGEEMTLSGEADAYGHRKLGGIADLVGAEVKQRTGNNVLIQPIRYLMRSGSPDALDLMAGLTCGSLAMQLIARGETGRMIAIRDGCYTTVPVQTVVEKRTVDVANFYDAEAYRPAMRDGFGLPMFLR